MAMSPRQGGYIAQMTSANKVPSSHSLEYQPAYCAGKLTYKVDDKGVERHV